jgi:hypothetical protein
MLERAAEPVELGDEELVAGAFGDQQRLVQLWASGELAAGVVDEDPLAPGRLERRRAELRDADRASTRARTRSAYADCTANGGVLDIGEVHESRYTGRLANTDFVDRAGACNADDRYRTRRKRKPLFSAQPERRRRRVVKDKTKRPRAFHSCKCRSLDRPDRAGLPVLHEQGAAADVGRSSLTPRTKPCTEECRPPVVLDSARVDLVDPGSGRRDHGREGARRWRRPSRRARSPLRNRSPLQRCAPPPVLRARARSAYGALAPRSAQTAC